jgi:hypothetical protein
MDNHVRHLIALRNALRNISARFHDMVEANERSIEPDSVGRVHDLIEASMNTIDEMSIN